MLQRVCPSMPYVLISEQKKKAKGADQGSANFAALHLLQDPQTFAERLFDLLSRFDKKYTLDHKILLMQVMCRAMGTHRLTVLPFYTYLLKYLTASQLRIPTILAALASSVHSLTPIQFPFKAASQNWPEVDE